ncbi:MAG TPA: alginate lyase family protein [Puia sp.]|jgi:hypothetical protein
MNIRPYLLLTNLSLTLLTGSYTLQAQYVGPGKPEIKKLKALIKAGDRAAEGSPEAEVKRFYTGFQQRADQALTEDPHPIDTIRSEGLLQGNPKKTATQFALTDMGRMYALALVYRVSGDKRYLIKTAAYLKSWALKNTPNGDPIDDTNLDPCIEAYDMVKEKLSTEDDGIIKEWLQRTAEIEISGPHNRPGRGTATNNWHSHRLKIIGEIAYAIGDTTLQGYSINGLKKQIRTNLNPDGSSTDFVSRDALHYHVYDLEPLLKLAIVLQRATGVDYYTYESPAGTSIKKSTDWLLPFLNGQKTHGEFVNSTVPFDRERAKNGEAAYKAGTLFDPKNGIQTLVLAAWFDPGLLPLARQLQNKGDHYPAWQSVVNELTDKSNQ